jgi:4-carboxymuconolactone decarboxylase
LEVTEMSKLPKRFTAFMENHPEIAQAYQALGIAVGNAGPLDPKTRQLIKVGVAIAAGLEGGTHSHVRKALEAGATPDEIRHTALQTLTTVGFPTMMKGLSWVEDVLGDSQEELLEERTGDDGSGRDAPFP